MKQIAAVAVLALMTACPFGSGGKQRVTADPFVTTPADSETASGSCANPIPLTAYNEAGGRAAERAYLAARYPGSREIRASRTKCNGRPADRVTIRTAEGKKVTVVFDTSSWVGKRTL